MTPVRASHTEETLTRSVVVGHIQPVAALITGASDGRKAAMTALEPRRGPATLAATCPLPHRQASHTEETPTRSVIVGHIQPVAALITGSSGGHEAVMTAPEPRRRLTTLAGTRLNLMGDCQDRACCHLHLCSCFGARSQGDTKWSGMCDMPCFSSQPTGFSSFVITDGWGLHGDGSCRIRTAPSHARRAGLVSGTLEACGFSGSTKRIEAEGIRVRAPGATQWPGALTALASPCAVDASNTVSLNNRSSRNLPLRSWLGPIC